MSYPIDHKEEPAHCVHRVGEHHDVVHVFSIVSDPLGRQVYHDSNRHEWDHVHLKKNCNV